MPGLPKSGVQLIAEDAPDFFRTLKKANEAVGDFGDATDKASGKVGKSTTIINGALEKMGHVAVDAAIEATKAIGRFVGDSISAAGDFEGGMNRFAAAAGGALKDSGKDLDDFKDLFISLGRELPVSTAEVQDAAIELVKGGIDPATVAAGGLRTALDLAAASGTGLAESATILSNQLGTWISTTADAATKSAFLAKSADLLGQAAGVTTKDVSDMALGLAQVGGVAKGAGLEFDELVKGLALVSPNFASASDAGTSFKAFLNNLQPTTKPAIQAMAQLGLATKDGNSAFYDAKGNFIGMAAAAELLQEKTAGLTVAEKALALETIFGSDAQRVALALSEAGAEGYALIAEQMAAVGTVQEQAAIQQQGFNTALENAKGSVEALQITIGTYLLPVLTTLLNDYIAPGISALGQLADAVFGNEEAFAALSPELQGIAETFQWIGDVVATTFEAFQSGGAEGGLQSLAQSLEDVNPSLAHLLEALAPIGGWLQDKLPGAIDATVQALGVLADIVGTTMNASFEAIAVTIETTGAALDTFSKTEWGQTLQRGATVVAAYFSGPFQTEVGRGVDITQAKLNELAASPWGQTLQRGAAVAQTKLGEFATYMAGPFSSDFQRGFDTAATAANTWTQTSQQAFTLVAGYAGDAGAYMIGPFASDFQRGVDTATSAISSFVNEFSRQADEIGQIIGDVLDTIQGFYNDFSNAGAALIDNLWEGMTGAFDNAINSARARLQELRDLLPGSEPADSSSPLTNLDEAGAGFVKNFAQGILDATPQLVDAVKVMGDAARGEVQALADELSDLVNDMIEDSLGGAAGLARARGGVARDVAGLRPSGRDTESARKQVGQARAAEEALRIAAQAIVGDQAVIVAKRDAEIAAIQATTDFEENKLRRIQEVKDKYAADEAAAADAYTKALDDHYNATVNLERAEEELTAARQRDVNLLKIAEQAQRDISGIQSQTDYLAQLDPALAKDFFDLRSKHILELAKLDQERINATSDAERAAIADQYTQIQKAQRDELALFKQTAASQGNEVASFFEKVSQESAATIAKIQGELGAQATGTAAATGLYAQLQAADQALAAANADKRLSSRERTPLAEAAQDLREQIFALEQQLATPQGIQSILGALAPTINAQQAAATQTLGNLGLGGASVGLNWVDQVLAQQAAQTAAAAQAQQDALAAQTAFCIPDMYDDTGYKVVEGNCPPGRAMGGPVQKGKPYIVGELGPEWFVPDQNGTIKPAATPQQIMQSNTYNSGGNSATINMGTGLSADQVYGIVVKALDAQGMRAQTRRSMA